MITKKTLCIAIALLTVGATAYAQEGRVGINTTTPATTLDVSGKLNTAGTAVDPADVTGLQAPRITLTELNAKGVSLYGASQKGALIYITSATAAEITAAASNTQAPNITATGYYYFDGTVWQKVTNGASATPEPWYNVATNTAATSNTENIYQMGKVMVGTATVPTGGTNAKLIIDNGTTNGAVQIKDGTETNGYVLTSDANGVGTWKNINTKILGSLTTTTVTTATSGSKYMNCSISLPSAGKYLIYVGLLASSNTGTAGQYALRLTLSTSSTALTNAGLFPMGNFNVILNPHYWSGMVTSFTGFVTGQFFVTVSAPTTLYLWDNVSSDYQSSAGNTQIQNNGENYFYAVPSN